MKKRILSLVSVVLCLTLAFSASAAAVGSEAQVSPVTTADSVEEAVAILTENDADVSENGGGQYTTCNGECGHCPSIIIPGIGQSKTYLADDSGNPVYDADGEIITGWPFYIDVKYAVKELLFPLLFALFTQTDIGFTDKAAEVVAELFSLNECDGNGNPVHNIKVEKYPQSVARCNAEEKNYIYRCIPIESYSDAVGEDHLYFLAYNSFGSNLDIAEELYQMIQQMKRETGHSKVNIVPISLGGTIANALLEIHPEVVNDLNRVVYIIPALNGSRIVSDLYLGKLSTSDEMLYDVLFPSLMDEDEATGELVNILIRLFPKKVVTDLLDKVLKSLTETILLNCPNMWGLVCKEDYPALREKWLSGSEHDAIRAKTDRYYQAQVNSLKNIQRLVDSGVSVFDVVDYSYCFYKIVPSWSEYNSDGIIQVESTGMGVDSVYIGQQFPAGYKQRNINKLGTNNCTDPTHNHISPDREIDASTCLLPEQTFFFYQQNHESTGNNDVIMRLATDLLKDDAITDVYSNPGYPQFNVGRTAKNFIRNTIPQAKAIDRSKLSPEDAAELAAAIEEAELVTNNTVVDREAYDNANIRLSNILIKIGYWQPPEDKSAAIAAKESLGKINDWLNKTLGYRGFTDPLIGQNPLFNILKIK